MIGKAAYVFCGSPGVGKGTLAQRCTQRFSWAALSTGTLCRKHINEQTEIGKQIDFIIKSGKLILDEMITGLVDEWIAQQRADAPAVILDCYPQSILQIYQLCRLLQTKYPSLQLHVIKLTVCDDVVINRLGNRLVCANHSCQAVYAAKGEYRLTPRQAAICDFCGSSLVLRNDDKSAVVRERLAAYYKHDLTEAFEEVGLSIEKLKADRPVDVIFNDFGRLIKRYERYANDYY